MMRNRKRKENVVHAVSDEDLERQLDGVKLWKKVYLRQQVKRFLTTWNEIFVVSCAIAVTVDPLFFYIPMINEEKKCIGFDRTWQIIATCLRSVTDLFYIANIILRFCLNKSSQKLRITKLATDYATGMRFYSAAKQVMSSQKLGADASEIASRYPWGYFLVDVLSILPIPQVAMTIMFLNMERSNYLEKRTWLNLAVFFQYGPRVLRIYLSWIELIKNGNNFAKRIRVKVAFNLFLYILGSHVLGAFWYLLSIERETTCWLKACKKNAVSVPNSYDCKKSSGNYTFLNDLCPINTTNTMPFDFGIFHQAIQSGILGSKNFPKKLLYCFWWGLQNVSSSGQNLRTSIDIWENCFTVFISIYGLLLFLYFVGNLQVYLSSKASKSLTVKEILSEKKEKMEIKRLQIGEWVFRNKLPCDIKWKILSKVEHIMDKNKDVDVDENLFLLLPPILRMDITLHLCLPLLNKVPMLQEKGKKWCRLICKYLKPVTYNENSYIVRAREPLDAMLLITYGTVTVLKTDTTSKPVYLGKGDFFGEKLLDWGRFDDYSHTPELSDLTSCRETVKTHTKVRGFVLTAKSLKDLVFYKNERAPVVIQRAWRRKHGHCNHHCHHYHHYHHQPAQPQSVMEAKDDANSASSNDTA